MQFRIVNPHSVRWLVPPWALPAFDLARSLDQMLGAFIAERYTSKRFRSDAPLPFWADAKLEGNSWSMRVAEPANDEERPFCGQFVLDHPEWMITLPLNDLLKGAPRLDGTHSLYEHGFPTEVPLLYLGITKRPWFVRLAEHRSSARAGSPYLFHRALREHASLKTHHRVLLSGIDQATAFKYEEEFVQLGTLYPLGLNMIPGGAAGIRYLASLGYRVASAEERDGALARIVVRSDLEGRPNPLCAARWSTDQDFVNRVVCGHSGRLTVEQVRLIKMLAASGWGVGQIASHVQDRARRVREVAGGSTYARIT